MGGQTWKETGLCFVSLQAQSQGSITLKIIPATQEEDRFKESKVWGGGLTGAYCARGSVGMSFDSHWEQIMSLVGSLGPAEDFNSVTGLFTRLYPASF